MSRGAEAAWVPDILPGFERLTLELEEDFEGPVRATLVRRAPGDARTDMPDAGVDLLYVHGWTDYFFQTHLAEFWESLGVRFHALDLRKHGRSMREHQTPGFVLSLKTYDEDVEAALTVIGHGLGGTTGRRIVLMGHSAGGLVVSLWAAYHPGRVAGLVLNSPWLEFQTREVGRRMLEPGVRAQAAIAPRSRLVNLDLGFYVRTISSRLEGEWDIDATFRPDEGWRITPAWLAAIFRGQDRVARGLGLEMPVLVLLSAASTPPVRWSEAMRRTDTVLDVVGVARRVPQLGKVVTLVQVDGALHDVTLSAPEVRDVVWGQTARWFHGYVGARHAAEPPARARAGWVAWLRARLTGRGSAPAPGPPCW